MNERFARLFAFGDSTFALKEDGTVVPLGEGETKPPAGRFTHLALGGGYTCGLQEDERVVCWGDLRSLPLLAKRGTRIVLGSHFTCTLDASAEARCFGKDNAVKTDLPRGPFTELVVGDEHACGVNEHGHVTCWGTNLHNQLDAPHHKLMALAAGFAHTCGIDENGYAKCGVETTTAS